MQLNITKRIDAPRDQVFALFSDFPNAAENVTGITKVEVLTDGPFGKGSRFKETRIMFKKEATEEMEVTEWVPGERYAIEAESCGAHYRTLFTFRPSGNGTEVNMTTTGKPLTASAKIMGTLMGFMMKGMMRKCIEGDMDDLKKKLEGAGAEAVGT